MEKEPQKVFSKQFKVCQFECDSGGGVAHAAYLNYLEEARHEVLTALHFPFEELKKQKLGFVVLRVEVDYRSSLITGDDFVIETVIQRISKRCLRFNQEIYRLPEKTIMTSGVIIGTTVNAENRAVMPEIIEILLTDYPVRKNQ